MAIVAERAVVAMLAEAVYRIVAEPLPEAPVVIVNHSEALLAAVQGQLLELVVRLKLPFPPAAGTLAEDDDSE